LPLALKEYPYVLASEFSFTSGNLLGEQLIICAVFDRRFPGFLPVFGPLTFGRRNLLDNAAKGLFFLNAVG